jgi:hypothetical protein
MHADGWHVDYATHVLTMSGMQIIGAHALGLTTMGGSVDMMLSYCQGGIRGTPCKCVHDLHTAMHWSRAGGGRGGCTSLG